MAYFYVLPVFPVRERGNLLETQGEQLSGLDFNLVAFQ
jgi:hypothetical protein